MALAAGNFFRGAGTTGGGATLFTASSNYVITCIDISNTGTTAYTCVLSLNGVILIPTITIPASSIFTWEGSEFLPSGDTCTATVSNAAVIISVNGFSGA